MIYNFSQFYYGYKVLAEPYNGFLDIDEGAGAISIQVQTGSYSLTGLAKALREALVAQATLPYLVNVDRTNRIITISSTSTFRILSSTGVNAGAGIYSLIGFKTISDYALGNTHSSVLPAGTAFRPQFKLQSYIDPEDFQQSHQAAVNVAASGNVVEVVNFGLVKFLQFDLKFITNRLSDGRVIRNNPTGVEDARNFMRFITQKSNFEFMPNVNDANTFFTVLCESTNEFSDGTGYKLKELYDKNLPDVYDSGVIKLRVIE